MADYWNADILVLGCGNVLFGDDGFGPAVADRLEELGGLPPRTCVLNAGLGVRDVLFRLALGEQRPRLVIVVDAVDEGWCPGEVAVRDVGDLPPRPIGDSSMHLSPTTHLLRELHDGCGVALKVVSVQARRVPEEVSPGLSDVVEAAVPIACDRILDVVRAQAARASRPAR